MSIQKIKLKNLGIEMLSKQYLHECFLYDNGNLYWKERPVSHFKSMQAKRRFDKIYAGKLSGSGNRVKVDKTPYRITKIIWLLNKDTPCPEYIGYKDLNENNKNHENLVATYRGQVAGLKRKTNTGYKRISEHNGRYLVRFRRENYAKGFKDMLSAVAHAKAKIQEFGYHDVI